jgi:hypothetical protein
MPPAALPPSGSSERSSQSARNSHDRTDDMGSSSKQKTTMAKLNRERALRERRLQKQAKKDARKQAAAAPQGEPRVAEPSGDVN